MKIYLLIICSVLGSYGSGKTSLVILPFEQTSHRNRTEAVVFIDFKGEMKSLKRMCSKKQRRKERGYLLFRH
jgi:Ni2+-binding GTPase involved in maturation of urease and hydrogenase